MKCRYDSAIGWRVLARHEDGCDRTDCDGCQPCAQRHCIVCALVHTATDVNVCAGCVGETRDALADVVRLSGALLDHAAYGGDDGRLLAGAPIPGADAMVMLAPGSDGRSQTQALLKGTAAPHTADEYRGDAEPPLQLLASWEDDWRLVFGHGGGPRATLDRAAGYLDRQLWRAAREHLAFDEFAADINRCRARLEDVLHDGVRDETGAPCVHCGATLIRDADAPHAPRADGDRGGLRDGWRCPRCRRTYDDRSYWNAVGAAYRAHASAMTDSDIEEQYGVNRITVRRLASTGHVKRRGKDARRRQLYDVADVRRHASSARTCEPSPDV